MHQLRLKQSKTNRTSSPYLHYISFIINFPFDWLQYKMSSKCCITFLLFSFFGRSNPEKNIKLLIHSFRLRKKLCSLIIKRKFTSSSTEHFSIYFFVFKNCFLLNLQSQQNYESKCFFIDIVPFLLMNNFPLKRL